MATAGGGEAAIAAIAAADSQGDPFDVLIIDWRMPELDGMDTARRITELKLSRPPNYVMVTGFDEPGLREKAGRLGFSSVLQKPVTASTLYDSLSAMVEGGSQRRPSPTQASAAERALRREHRGKRLLLAEDNPINREVTLELLRDVGLHVDIATNGREAVEKAKHHEYDLVLMDMQMPEMDGLEATRIIRMLPEWTDTPIIAMTANAFGEDRSACLAAGMNDHLGKPAAPADLFAVLLNWLGKQRAVSAASRRKAAMRAKMSEQMADQPTGPDALPSLDVPRLLSQVKHDSAFVRRLLQLAAAEHRDDPARLSDSAARGDFDAAFKIAHHIKGTASQIEAKTLFACASGAEAKWRRGEAVDAAQLEALTSSLNKLLAEIDRYLGPT